MEQREGRGDRFGRLLKEPLSILYCLVPRTYDERMFLQLVARDRWHGVLLARQRRSSHQTKEAKKCGLNPPERASVTFPGSLAANPMNGLQS